MVEEDEDFEGFLDGEEITVPNDSDFTSSFSRQERFMMTVQTAILASRLGSKGEEDSPGLRPFITTVEIPTILSIAFYVAERIPPSMNIGQAAQDFCRGYFPEWSASYQKPGYKWPKWMGKTKIPTLSGPVYERIDGRWFPENPRYKGLPSDERVMLDVLAHLRENGFSSTSQLQEAVPKLSAKQLRKVLRRAVDDGFVRAQGKTRAAVWVATSQLKRTLDERRDVSQSEDLTSDGGEEVENIENFKEPRPKKRGPKPKPKDAKVRAPKRQLVAGDPRNDPNAPPGRPPFRYKPVPRQKPPPQTRPEPQPVMYVDDALTRSLLFILKVGYGITTASLRTSEAFDTPDLEDRLNEFVRLGWAEKVGSEENPGWDATPRVRQAKGFELKPRPADTGEEAPRQSSSASGDDAAKRPA